jgi:hypothetical protein
MVWQDNMINYTLWPIILPTMKAIGPTTSEFHSQSEVGQTNAQTKYRMQELKLITFVWDKSHMTLFLDSHVS